ncbi:MAG: biotin-dependent carboxyltransferase family protein [Ilumatobacter sp.]|nr:biotin-dependent carboxyltransferase family protein [Ilumatobacter sp.]
MSLEVVESGMLSTVQDGGRPGWAHVGVPHSGVVDPSLAAVVNRLVGNPGDAALIETVGGLLVRATGPLTIASDTEPVARTVRAGDTIRVPLGGRQWHYLSIRGGVVAEPVLGSRSTDTLSGLGPAPLAAGDRLSAGAEPAEAPHGETVPVHHVVRPARILPGPRLDWFEPDVLEAMELGRWRVTTSSRVGVRLSGHALARVDGRELPSEGLVRGAIQVPPDGDPIMMLADHPTTGGYPVVAVVHPDDVSIVAQTTVGGDVTFRLVR